MIAALGAVKEAGLIGKDVNLPSPGQPIDPEQARQRLSNALRLSLPEGFGTIPLYDSSALAQIQHAISLFRWLVLLLIGFAVVFTAGGFLLAPRRRLSGIILGLAVVMFILNLVGTATANRFLSKFHGQVQVIVRAAANPLLASFTEITGLGDSDRHINCAGPCPDWVSIRSLAAKTTFQVFLYAAPAAYIGKTNIHQTA